VADDREPRRRQADPLLAVAAEAARAGLRGADYVVEGLSETLRRGTGDRSGGAAAGRQRAARTRARRARSKGFAPTTPPGSESPSSPVTGSTVDLLVELLERFGEAIQDTAGAIAEREWFDGEPKCPTLELRGAPGHPAAVEFAFTNTSPSVLAKVTFEATDLIGVTEQIDAGAVSFKYENDPYIPRVGPGASARVIVAVEIPEAPAGTYRGVIAARSAAPEGRAEAESGPEGAWAVLELEVAAMDPRSAIAPIERSREA
jgi:hypothetical protein